jgi:hypothetical protein
MRQQVMPGNRKNRWAAVLHRFVTDKENSDDKEIIFRYERIW